MHMKAGMVSASEMKTKQMIMHHQKPAKLYAFQQYTQKGGGEQHNMKNENQILARGAEAIIYKLNKKVIKDRIPKSYRHPTLDLKLIKRRTKSESKILSKAVKIIPVPKLLSDPKPQGRIIHMEYISGKRLSDHLSKLKPVEITHTCKQIGKNIAKLHDAGIIHGDLTTSNMILRAQNKRVYFIDFGLGFHSNRIEDKAVDLHLIKQALEAKHPKIYKKAFKAVIEGYKISKNYKQTLTRLQKVEKRGRYKTQY